MAESCQHGQGRRGPRSGCPSGPFHDCHFHPQTVNSSPADESRHRRETSLHCTHSVKELESMSEQLFTVCDVCAMKQNNSDIVITTSNTQTLREVREEVSSQAKNNNKIRASRESTQQWINFLLSWPQMFWFID